MFYPNTLWEWLWHGMAWYGIVWYGMAWYGMVWHGMVWYGMAWHGMAWHGTPLLPNDGHISEPSNTYRMALVRSRIVI